MHPLVDFSGLSLDELDNKYFDLSKKLVQARQFMGSQAVGQLELILDSINQERIKRLQQEVNQKLKENNIIDTDPIKEGSTDEQKPKQTKS